MLHGAWLYKEALHTENDLQYRLTHASILPQMARCTILSVHNEAQQGAPSKGAEIMVVVPGTTGWCWASDSS